MNPVIAFNTANLVAQVTNWKFELKHWGDQHKATVAKTDEKQFEAICKQIALAGYSAVELWIAHIDPAGMTDKRAANYRSILSSFGLTPIAIAGGINAEHARVATLLNIPQCCGGIGGTTPAEAAKITHDTGIRFNHENHPEKTVDEIRKKIDFGVGGIGIAVDTGWMGTQALPAPAAILELGSLVKHVHLKDIKASGAHETVKLGTGIVDIPGCVASLKKIGYTGPLSWEDEPEDRNPFDIAVEMRLYIQQLWRK
jgi:L-ribulose-5-phosphate 3-epimerase